MRQKRAVLVTGGAGFIGSHLVQSLAKKGYFVRVLDNLSTGKLANINSELMDSGSVEFVKGDIRNAAVVKDCVASIDVVFHLAAQTSVPFSITNPDFNNEVNIKGTQNLLNASTKEGVSKFIFVSSAAVYGEPAYLPVDENHPTNPISPYAESKLAGEKECLSQTAKASVVLRFFNVYGPKQGLNDYSGVITKFMDKIKEKQSLTIYGDGSQTRDFVYVQDIVNALILALQNNNVNGQVFNIGTGKAATIKELAQTMLSLTGTKLEIINAPARIGDIKQSYANITKANKLLGYKPNFTLKEGLKELLNQNNLLPSPRKIVD